LDLGPRTRSSGFFSPIRMGLARTRPGRGSRNPREIQDGSVDPGWVVVSRAVSRISPPAPSARLLGNVSCSCRLLPADPLLELAERLGDVPPRRRAGGNDCGP